MFGGLNTGSYRSLTYPDPSGVQPGPHRTFLSLPGAPVHRPVRAAADVRLEYDVGDGGEGAASLEPPQGAAEGLAGRDGAEGEGKEAEGALRSIGYVAG